MQSRLPESTGSGAASELEAEPTPRGADRWSLIRDAIVFQFKLGLDGLRDVLLSPISLVAVLVDLLLPREGEGRFHQLLGLGRKTDTWINLFGGHDRSTTHTKEIEGVQSFDSIVAQVEQLIVREYERGGVTASAKEAIDRSLDALSEKPR